ncbi:MAG TPA: tRNA (adenosine(37)-N6)-dimethylallyltransferase MiaA [Gemmatimonadaceae bacterium]|nr:tRNA (adenosine(37)-N6)-dimethylallyltransferase MiaA [Gemmatimonadaceae bacterium]
MRVICGPTAAGKSAIALELADAFNAAIVSADSRQIYCDFDIGTAKPHAVDCARVTHYGIDVLEPDERYSAARWVADAEEWIECACEIEKEPLIVGGTGLYIKALVEPLFAAPEVDPGRRGQLEQQLEGMSLADLRRWCGQLDPARAHLGRTQLLRAIETALLSGSRISELHARDRVASEGVDDSNRAIYLVVDPGPALAGRIEQRVNEMFDAGWADEVRDLIASVAGDAPAWKASGYAVMRDHVEGRIDLSSARERIIIETRQFAKRQRTWFRHQLPPAAVTTLNPDDSRSAALAREWWERAE